MKSIIKLYILILILIFSCLSIVGCSTWSTSSVRPANGTSEIHTSGKRISPADVIVIDSDVTNREYIVLGDVEATVHKTTIFDDDPTKAQVNKKLKQEAAKIGADAVIMARYGNVGMSHMSYGTLNGKGRAIAFKD